MTIRTIVSVGAKSVSYNVYVKDTLLGAVDGVQCSGVDRKVHGCCWKQFIDGSMPRVESGGRFVGVESCVVGKTNWFNLNSLTINT